MVLIPSWWLGFVRRDDLCGRQGFASHPADVPAVAQALAIEIDAHGSPVTVAPAQWLVVSSPD